MKLLADGSAPRASCAGCSALYAKNRVLVLGQFISVLIACTGVFSQLLNRSYEVRLVLLNGNDTSRRVAQCMLASRSINTGPVLTIQRTLLTAVLQIQIPVTQSAGNYLLLCLYLVDPVMRYRRQQGYKLEVRVPGLGAYTLSLVANWTTSTHKLLLHVLLQIPWWKYLLLALADVEGNFLVVCAYKYTSISSVMLLDCFTIPVVMLLSATFLRAKYTRSHYVAVLFCLAGISVLVISDVIRDRETMLNGSFDGSALYGDLLCLLGSATYACSNVGQEYLIFLTTGDAAVFNLSLLTSDFFAVVAAKYLFNEELSSLYFVGFSLIIGGVSVYNRSAPPTTATELADLKDGSLAQLLPAHTEP
ncbi:hypothetical protein BBJ28_00010759 [Nothophytophthora sp. Chile5]|nr:hypothetical protein BBJ28_00010759 [Nothophytophthora sp. Chile5]